MGVLFKMKTEKENKEENQKECNNQDPVQDQPTQTISPQKQSKKGKEFQG